jgi:hypothetical protein
VVHHEGPDPLEATNILAAKLLVMSLSYAVDATGLGVRICRHGASGSALLALAWPLQSILRSTFRLPIKTAMVRLCQQTARRMMWQRLQRQAAMEAESSHSDAALQEGLRALSSGAGAAGMPMPEPIDTTVSSVSRHQPAVAGADAGGDGGVGASRSEPAAAGVTSRGQPPPFGGHSIRYLSGDSSTSTGYSGSIAAGADDLAALVASVGRRGDAGEHTPTPAPACRSSAFSPYVALLDALLACCAGEYRGARSR